MGSDAGIVLCVVLLGLSASFDSIDHKILTLTGFGAYIWLRLTWFSSYLSDRSFTVRTDRFTSNVAPLTCGVLGPLLFSTCLH